MAKLRLDDYLPALDETTDSIDGRPLLLALDQIDEDPSQPRSEFDNEALEELAASIKARGVLQPISVRHHPERPGRYLLNFGARRVRASRRAGKGEIPAFLDELATGYDQVIENEHREGLRPMELALFVKRELEAGRSQAGIAARLGKSRAYVCYVSALIDAPDWLMQVYREGRCRGVKELYDLRRLHEEHGEAVVAVVASHESISRLDIDAVRTQLTPKVAEAGVGGPPADDSNAMAEASVASPRKTGAGRHSAQRRSRYMLLAEAGGVTVKVVLDDLPPQPDDIYVFKVDAKEREAIPIAKLTALRLLRNP